jgi:cystathionine beta-lyase
MMYDFDTVYDRASGESLKWANRERICGSNEVIPMWVADMDFASPPEVVQAIRERAEHPVFGYPLRTPSYYRSLIEWMKRRHGWDIESDWIQYVPGVVPALNFAVQAFTKPGDSICIQPPVYYPFRKSVLENGRRMIENQLAVSGLRYAMDFEGLERAIDSTTRMLVLCSPHNPVGRVWKPEELQRLVDICVERGIILVADEIHADLVLEGRHTCVAGLSSAAADITVTLTAPNKTFNIAGLTMGNAIIPNEGLRSAYKETLERCGIEVSNIFGNVALEAAYMHGDTWLDELLLYVRQNFELVRSVITEKIPELRVFPLEGTYLAWIDCRGLGLDDDACKEFFFKEAKLWLDDGKKFGSGGSGFMRMNLACPRSLVQEALERLEKAILARRNNG